MRNGEALIRKLEHFVRLSEEDKEMLKRISAARVRKLVARDDLIREGEPPHVVNLMLEGWACRYKDLEDGRRQIISLFLPGDLCDLNIFVLRKMDHSIGALTDLSVAEIPREVFDELTEQFPRVTQALLWETLVNTAIQREWTVNLGQRDASERMAHLLCELFLRLRAVGLADGNSCAMPLTQAELGEAVGLSTVHVNRVLQTLRTSRLIVLKEKTLIIPDLERLMDACMFNIDYLHLDHEGRHLDANR